MTRFARAKGSKASNERLPEQATPWSQMKQDLLNKKKENEEIKKREEANRKRNANYKAFLDQREEEQTKKTEWAQFPEAPSVVNKHKKISKFSISKPHVDSDEDEGFAELKEKLDKVLNSKQFSNTYESDSDSPPVEKSAKEPPVVQVTNIKKPKKKLLKIVVDKEEQSQRRNKEAIQNSEAEGKTSNKPTKKNKNALQKIKNCEDTGEKQIKKAKKRKHNENVGATEATVQNKKIKTKGTNENKTSETRGTIVELSVEEKELRRKEKLKKKYEKRVAKKKLRKEEARLQREAPVKKPEEELTEEEKQKIQKKNEKRIKQLEKRKKNRQLRKENELQNNNSNALETPSANEVDKNNQIDISNDKRYDAVQKKFRGQTFQHNEKIRKPGKVRDNNEHQPKKLRPHTMFINGKTIEIEYVDGFPVKRDDADRLKKLRKEMISKGLPRSEINIALKLERRKAEKAFSREKKNVCFNCRKSGHNLSECPELGKNQIADSAGTGICFKCGSTEHTHFECKVVKGMEYNFAQCFICNEQGHIARQCPDNARGLYPKGGACKVCGDVTHLKKDCPKYHAQQDQLQSKIHLGTLNEQNPDVLDNNEGSSSVGINKRPNKIVKF